MQNLKATVIAVSTDDLATQKKFKEELKAPFSFVADDQAKLAKLYDVKAPVMNIVTRNTFVIGPDRKVIGYQKGSDAIDPSAAIQACALRRPTAADAGK